MFPTDPLAAVCAVLVAAAIAAAVLRFYREAEIVARYDVRAEAIAEAERQAAEREAAEREAEAAAAKAAADESPAAA